MTGDNRPADDPRDQGPALSQAAAQGPIAGIDDADEAAAEDEKDEEDEDVARTAAPKLSREDEAEQIIGFRGLR